MQWLVTTKANIDTKQLMAKLAAWGCTPVNDETAIALDNDEQVIEVTGPNDLPDRIKDDDTILEVYPSSEMSLY